MRVRPAHRVVVVGLDPAELVQSLRQELGGLQLREAREWRHLVEGALERTFRRGAVVADDQVDQRVVQNPRSCERVDQPSDVMVGVLHEAGIHLHLAGEDRLHRGVMVSQAGISGWRAVSWQSGGMTPSSFCRAKVSSRSLSQPWSNLPLYLSAHSFGT